MNCEQLLQLPDCTQEYVNDRVIARLPNAQRSLGREKVDKLLNKYDGVNAFMLLVLSAATEEGRFDEFAYMFNEFHGTVRKKGDVERCTRSLAFLTSCFSLLSDGE